MFSSAFLTIFAFGAIIFIHELGHFLAAIRVGVRVEKFYLGFDFWGCRLFSFKHKGTEYGIGIFPLGGYVKMAGQEDIGPARVSHAPDEFPSKTVWQRAQILSGGVVFNFISAFLFSALALWMGYRLTAPRVGELNVGGAAWSQGIREGDLIRHVEGVPVNSFTALFNEVALSGADEPLNIGVTRGGKDLELSVLPDMDQNGFATLGVGAAHTFEVGGLSIDGAAKKAGIEIGDTILAIDGVELKQWEALHIAVRDAGPLEKGLLLSLERQGERFEKTVVPTATEHGILGLTFETGTEVYAVQPGSPAHAAGIRPGMKLVAMDGEVVEDWSEFGSSDYRDLLSTDAMTLTFNSVIGDLVVPWTLSRLELLKQLQTVPLDGLPPKVHRVEGGSAAQAMGFLPGDVIRSLTLEDGKKVNIKQRQQFSVRNLAGQNVSVMVERQGESLTLEGKVGTKPYYLLGVSQDTEMVKDAGLSTVLWWPFHMLRQAYRSVLGLATGKVSAKNLSGPLGIISVTYQVASAGLGVLFYLMAFLSINIAFLNILPIPVLDGGHLMFCLIEWVKGSPVSETAMIKFQYLGLALLLTLFSVATFNDILRFLT